MTIAGEAAHVTRIVRCPHCGGRSVYATTNPWRPFCSERCRQVDLGAWGNEDYRMAAPPPSEIDLEPDLGSDLGPDRD